MTDRIPTDEQVLDLAARGYSPRDIAHRLGVEERAVRNAVSRIRRRLGARSLDHAVQIHQTQGVAMPDQTPGQIAYAAYGKRTGGRNFLGQPMPAWDDLPPTIQAAWGAAAAAILTTAADHLEGEWAAPVSSPPSREEEGMLVAIAELRRIGVEVAVNAWKDGA